MAATANKTDGTHPRSNFIGSTTATLPRLKRQRALRSKSFVSWGKFDWVHAGKIVALVLVAQFTIVQATVEGKTSHEGFSFETKSLLSPLNGKQPNEPLEDAEKEFGHGVFDGSSKHRYQIDLNETLSLFNDFDVSLQEAISMFNSSSTRKPNYIRKARDANILGSRAQCTVAKDRLQGLQSEIKITLTQADTTQSAGTCELDSNNLDNCNELMKLIQCGVDHLKRSYMESVFDGVTLDKVSRLKNAYDELSEKYNKGIDDAKNAASQESNHMLDKLKTQLQNLGNQLKEQLENLKKKIQELCVSEIHSGRETEAVGYFEQLNDDSQLPKIVRDAYDRLSSTENSLSYKLNNVEKILKFIKKLSSHSQAVPAYKSLYDSMELNDHLRTPQVLELDEALGLALKNTKDEILLHLKLKLSSHVRGIVVATWAQARDYGKLRSYAKKSLATNENIEDLMSEIIIRLYADRNADFDNVLNFIRELPNIGNLAVGYNAFFQELRRCNHVYNHTNIMKLAYRTKQAMNMGNQDIKREIFANLKSSFPKSVRDLTWSDNCHIKSDFFKEFLYAASDGLAFDSSRRSVFTWRQGNMASNFKWLISTDNYGDTFTFKFLSRNEYLYAASDYFNYNKNRRRVFTRREGHIEREGYWKLEPSDKGNFFRIQNTWYNEYLYAATNGIAYDDERRNVFTWITGEPQLEGDWEFVCR